jgi:Cu/Ag efflux protein CusF
MARERILLGSGFFAVRIDMLSGVWPETVDCRWHTSRRLAMLRRFLCAAFALVLCVGVTLAEEVKGKIKSVDADKGTMTVTVDGKDQEYKIGTDTKLLNAQGKDLKDGIKNARLKEGQAVTLTTEKKDGKDVVTEVKLGGGKKKPAQ